MLDGSGAVKQASYQLMGELPTGGAWPTAAPQVFFDRPDLATVTAGSPVIATAGGPYAGTGTLTALRGVLTATARLIIKQEVTQLDPAVMTPIADALRVPSLPADPKVNGLIYPYDRTLFPLGLSAPLVMWNAVRAGDLYLLRLERSNYRFDFFFVGALPGRVRVPQAQWDQATTASVPSDPLRVTLRRYDVQTSMAYAAATQEWTIVDKSLRGAIYYWTTSGGGHLARMHTGLGSTPQSLANGQCMGCHAVSADGSRLVASVEAAYSADTATHNRAWVSYDLPSGAERTRSQFFGGNLALNPNGKYIIYGTAPLKLGDAATGAAISNTGIESLPLEPGMTTYAHPAFSPDGTRIAAVESSLYWYVWQVSRLVVARFDEATVKVTQPVLLAATADFPTTQRAIGYPSFTPDSANVAFHVSDWSSGCNTTCAETTPGIGALYMQSASGGAAPVRLDRLNDSSTQAADHNVSFEPTFNPQEIGGYHWVVFTSTRDWGNQLTGAPTNGKKRLWVAAVDKQVGTSDPSHPAFFLEGQEDTMNMRGFWTLSACTPTGGADAGACAAGFECCSGFCSEGQCVDRGVAACKSPGASCAQTSDCCEPGVFVCNEQHVCGFGIN